MTGPIGRARWDDFLEQFQRDLPRPALRVKIFRCSSDPNQWLFPRCPVSTRGADRASSRTRDGMRWTQQRQARDVVCRAGFPVSGHGAQDDRRCSVRQNRVVLAPVAGVKLPVANSVQPDRLRHQAGSDGGKRNSSPGRARHKSSTHCAGDAGVLRLYLYARVRNSLHHCTRDRGCSKHPAFPAPSVLRERNFSKARAQVAPRERRHTFICQRPPVRNCALGRTIQYSRDVNDGIDKPQRTDARLRGA